MASSNPSPPMWTLGFNTVKDFITNIFTRIDLYLFNLLFYKLNTEETMRFEWHHWTSIRNWGLIILGVLWVVPVLVLNVSYGITTTGCSSQWGRDWLGSFCADPHLNLNSAAQRPPWYVDLWDAQDNTTHSVRLPAPDRNLVVGHFHICDAEHYLHQQLADISLLPDDLQTADLQQELEKALAMSSTLCTQLFAFSGSFTTEKDIQNHAFRSLVEAYASIIVRSDRMHLSFGHYWVAPINPVIRLLNKDCRIPYILQPRLFDFQTYTEIRFQLQHFLKESRQSMDRVEAKISHFSSRDFVTSLRAAARIFEEFQRRIGQERETKRSFTFEFMHHILPARYFHSPEGMNRLNEYHDISIHILQRLKDFEMSLAAYDISIANMKRQHNRLSAVMASKHSLDLGRNGVIQVPWSEVSNFTNASFIDFQNPSLGRPEDGLTGSMLHYEYDLDTVFSHSDLAALRQAMVRLCLEETNVNIVSGFLDTICILWRQITSRSEFDGDILGPVQRSWSFELTRATAEHRRLIGYDDESISEDFVKYYREYRDGEEAPAFV